MSGKSRIRARAPRKFLNPIGLSESVRAESQTLCHARSYNKNSGKLVIFNLILPDSVRLQRWQVAGSVYWRLPLHGHECRNGKKLIERFLIQWPSCNLVSSIFSPGELITASWSGGYLVSLKWMDNQMLILNVGSRNMRSKPKWKDRERVQVDIKTSFSNPRCGYNLCAVQDS